MARVESIINNRPRKCLGYKTPLEVASANVARDGKEVQKRVRKNPDGIDLLVLDIVMPRIDGFSVLRWMKEKGYTGRFPVLVISGVYKPGEEVNRFKALGVCGVMTKQFTTEQIIHHIHLMLYPRKKDKRLLQRAPVAVPLPLP